MMLPPPPPPPPGAEPLLSLTNVTLTYAEDAPVLVDVDLAITPGMRVLLLGVTGVGKSTLLHALAGRLRPRAGTRTVGRLVQTLYWDQTAREGCGGADPDAEVPLDFLVRLGGGDDATCEAALASVGIDGLAARRPTACLSSGERTLLMLAALSTAPKHLLLLDEPAAFLGRAAVDALGAALAPEVWPGALVFTSSSAHCCEALRPTHVAHVAHGRVRLAPSPLWTEDEVAAVAAFSSSGDVGAAAVAGPSALRVGMAGGAGGTAVYMPDDDEEMLDDAAAAAVPMAASTAASTATAAAGAGIAGGVDSMAATMAMSMAMLKEMGVPADEAFAAMQTGAVALQSVLSAEQAATSTAQSAAHEDDDGFEIEAFAKRAVAPTSNETMDDDYECASVVERPGKRQAKHGRDRETLRF